MKRKREREMYMPDSPPPEIKPQLIDTVDIESQTKSCRIIKCNDTSKMIGYSVIFLLLNMMLVILFYNLVKYLT